MELLLIIACAFVGFIIVAATILGITLHDIRSIRLDKDFRRHPYAKRFRNRPLVSIIIDGQPTNECLKSIRRSNYRKIEVVKDMQSVKGKYILALSADTILERTAISNAIRRCSSDPTISRVELVPTIKPARTVRQFFAVYHQIVATPFTYARAGLNIFLSETSWPIVINTQIQTGSLKPTIYTVLRWLGNLANLFVLSYLTYIAIVLMQPEFLLGYLVGFSLWMVWSITGNQQLSLMQKIVYTLLAPASFGYFIFRCIMAPFWPKQYKFLVSFFVRALQPSR